MEENTDKSTNVSTQNQNPRHHVCWCCMCVVLLMSGVKTRLSALFMTWEIILCTFSPLIDCSFVAKPKSTISPDINRLCAVITCLPLGDTCNSG